MKKKTFLVIALFMLSIIWYSCSKSNGTKPSSNGYLINNNITPIFLEDHYGLVNIPCAVFFGGDKIFTTNPVGYVELNNDQTYLRDSIIFSRFGGQYIELSNNNSNILYVKSKWSDVSEGSLYEIELNNYNTKELLDSTNNISSATYYRDTSKIIFYSYGNNDDLDAGYYMYNKRTKEKSVILKYMNEAMHSEYINGFDVHPTKDILLIPVVEYNKPPRILKYNFESNTSDTLNIAFDISFNRICLWLRYNSIGNKVLYSCYPRGTGSNTTNDDSEIGIIDMHTLYKVVLDVNTSEDTGKSVNICPNWSPNEKHIVYTSTEVTLEGAIGNFCIYILRNINH